MGLSLYNLMFCKLALMMPKLLEESIVSSLSSIGYITKDGVIKIPSDSIYDRIFEGGTKGLAFSIYARIIST